MSLVVALSSLAGCGQIIVEPVEPPTEEPAPVQTPGGGGPKQPARPNDQQQDGTEIPFTGPPTALSSTCVSISDNGHVVTIDIDTGALTEGARIEATDTWFRRSLGVRGDDIYSCDESQEKGMWVVHRTTGQVTQTDIECESVTVDDRGIWIQSWRSSDVQLFEDLDAAKAKRSSVRVAPQTVSAVGPGEREVWAAWHSSDHVVRVDRTTGATEDLQLEGFDDWIYGLSATTQGRLVVSTPGNDRNGPALLVFDAATGRLSKEIPLPNNRNLYGLSCTAAGAVK